MRKRIAGKRLSRPSDARRALLRSLLEALFTHDSIRTTLAKAKAVKPLAEKLITKAKNKDNASYARVQSYLFKKETIQRLVKEIAPRFATRPGGYTRIIKLGPRRSDFAEMAILELVEKGKIKDHPPTHKATGDAPRSLDEVGQSSKIKNKEEVKKEKVQEISKDTEIFSENNAKDNNKA